MGYLKMENELFVKEDGSLGDLFVTSTKWLDAVINLKSFRAAKEKTKEQTSSDKHRIEVPDWSIVEMLWKKYTRAYGHLVVFFANEIDGKNIGIKFKPVGELKGLQAECLGGVGKDAQNELFINKAGIMNDLKIMGEGLVESISVQKDL